MLTILSHLGCEVERASGVVSIRADKIRSEAPYELVRKMRASVCVLGPLLGREHEACVSLPGGCVIGDRPIDLHLRGFESLGAAVRVQAGNVKLFAPELKGNTVNMRGIHGTTVLGTDNVMMAAVLARGTTVIDGAAEEPEVVDLANFLISLGAKIEGAGTSRIVVEGVEQLHGTDYTVIPDRIEAGTFLLAAAITRSDLRVAPLIPEHLGAVLTKLEEVGFLLRHDGVGTSILASQRHGPELRGVDLRTQPFPGFPTDLQAPFMSLLTTVPGSSMITESIFENRLQHVAELQRMGADIRTQGNTAVVEGVARLSGAPVKGTDLRASAAMVLAGLAADGTTTVRGLDYLDRGYAQLERKLSGVGARLQRLSAQSQLLAAN
jgi:UDP-N-acetylglucosamine 1-carboxyvinyltransferase